MFPASPSIQIQNGGRETPREDDKPLNSVKSLILSSNMQGKSANSVDIDRLGSSLMVGEISDSSVAGLC